MLQRKETKKLKLKTAVTLEERKHALQRKETKTGGSKCSLSMLTLLQRKETKTTPEGLPPCWRPRLQRKETKTYGRLRPRGLRQVATQRN